MALAEQPLKKRKLYEPLAEHPSPPPQPPQSPPPPPPPQTPQTPQQTFPTPPLSQEEILRRRRNREEIRSLYDCYKRIKYCVSQKDARLMPDLEQAYLSLITASRGCTSVQRVVADLIPRYAPYCPTALEAAAQVVINMHNWSLALINKGEDSDGIAFETAKSCIFGLVEICCTSALEAPTSSVIQGICSAVFLSVLSFFISCFEGKDIFQIVDKDILKMQDSSELFSELKEKYSDENESALFRLSKFRALSLLKIFFCCPQHSLGACFELLDSTGTEGVNKGHYFFSQVTNWLDAADMTHPLATGYDGAKLLGGPMETGSEGKEVLGDRQVRDGSYVSRDPFPVSRNCLLGRVLGKDLSLRSWIFSKYKKLRKLASSQVVSEITSLLERVFGSFREQFEAEESQPDSDEDDSNSAKYVNRRYLVSGISNQLETSSEISVRENTSKLHDRSHSDDLAGKFSGEYSKLHNSSTPLETDVASTSSNLDSGGSRSTEFESGDHGLLSHARSGTPRDLSNYQLFSPAARKPLDLRSNSFECRNHFIQTESNQVPNMDCSSAALRPSSGIINCPLESPKHHLPAPYPPSSQVIWYTDGEPVAMDIYAASRQLWLGSLGPDASEARVRIQFEKFGLVNQFLFFLFEGFAIVEYRNIMDAIKAREVMQGHSPWGTCLHIKFLDIGLCTREGMKGVAVCSSCHIYIGNVRSQWAKDEILHESRKVVYKGPCAVTDLASEGALLMEFDAPEEATSVMGHLRQHRKENSTHMNANVKMHADAARSQPACVQNELRSSNPARHIVGSTHVQTPLEEVPESFSHPRKQQASPLMIKHESNAMEYASPQINSQNNGATLQGGHAFQSNRIAFDCKGTPEVGLRKIDGYENMVVNPLQAGGRFAPAATEQMWMYGKPDMELQSAPGSIPCMPVTTQGPPILPSLSIQASPFLRPVYFPPNSSWEGRGLNHHLPLNPITPGVMPNSFHGSTVAPPFLPASVTPLAQIQGSSMPQFDQMFSLPVVPPPLTSLPPPQPDMHLILPPQPDLAPPLDPSPPPLPQSLTPMVPPLPRSLPPMVPPPPSSPPPPPPPPPPMISSNLGSYMPIPHYQWQATLSKSGVHYCTVYASRMDSEICKYSNSISEPSEWPAKLDMTKRTDFRHVKSTFSSTPPHKREVCQLLPSSEGDHKGFQDFISYLKQRECAGVIKIPSVKSMWTRLLFILPYSFEMCSLLSIAPNSLDCLIALVLPKETNFEWV